MLFFNYINIMLYIKNEDYKTKENNLLQSICASRDPVSKDEKKI